MSARSDIARALLRERLRLGALLAVLFGALLYLGAALHREQIDEARQHASALDGNSIRRVRLPATRGRILDRDGTPLAESVPCYALGIFVEELRQRGAWSNTVQAVDALVDELAAALGRPREITREDIAIHIHRRRPLALTAWRNLTDADLARIAETPVPFRGVDIQILPDRIYPQGDCAAHVIGYVGRGQPAPPVSDDPSEEDAAEDFDYYLPDLVGRSGIEHSLDASLAGVPGGELVRIDASGYKHAASIGRAPRDGADVVLSLRLPWQRLAEELLGGRRGAVVVVDVRTGEIPVLASSPRYDLSEFLPTLRPDTWKRLLEDPDHPLVNRATQAIYAPGSTLKPFVALAALDAGTTTPGRIIECGGAFSLGGERVLKCGHRYGHGPIDLETAIEQSCNVYFCQLGTELGYEPRLRAALADIGLGERPALEIPARAGLLPSDAWKRRVHRDGWRHGDTANLSIGQGFLCVTPLQMALATAAIANGGDLLAPRLVLSPRPAGDPGRTVVRHLPWKPSSLAAVRRGMHRVIDAKQGGGRNAHVDGLELAGKTGTAEYATRDGIRKNTWMIAYGPYRAPAYAMAVIIEDGDTGNKTAAPVVRHLFAAMYGLDPAPDPEATHEEYIDLAPEPEAPVPESESPEVRESESPGVRESERQGVRESEGGLP